MPKKLKVFLYEYDTYEYRDQYDTREELINSILTQLRELKTLKQAIKIFHNGDLPEELKFEKLGGILKI